MFYDRVESLEQRSIRLQKKIEDREQQKASPACSFQRLIHRNFKHCYGSYRSFEEKLIFEINYFTLREDQLRYGRSVIIRSILVLPEYRRNQVAKRFIMTLTGLSEQTGCMMVTVCKPFQFTGWDDLAGNNPFERCVETAKSFSEYYWKFPDLKLKIGKNRQKRKRMKGRFMDSGFEPVNIREDMEHPRKNGPWSLAYVPGTLDREFLESITWRLPRRKNNRQGI